MIETPLPLEQTDKELADLVKWITDHSEDIKNGRAFIEWKKTHPYDLCPCESGKKVKFCECTKGLTLTRVE